MTEIFLFTEPLTLGTKVHIARVARHWSQNEVARRAGVPQGSVSALERDCRVYPAARQRIVQLLQINEVDGNA